VGEAAKSGVAAAETERAGKSSSAQGAKPKSWRRALSTGLCSKNVYDQPLNLIFYQNEKVRELSQKISETRAAVAAVKSTIDGMRSTRDEQMTQMSSLKAKLR